MDDTADVVVATRTFGLSINKAGIRRVIHAGAPRGLIDGYYQEVSRGGRAAVRLPVARSSPRPTTSRETSASTTSVPPPITSET